MATLDDLIDEQNRIAEHLQRMADNPDTTEDDSGNLRDTLIKRWEEIEPERKKLTAELEKLNLIRKRAAEDASNVEAGDGGQPQVSRFAGGGPEFMQRRDPLADRDASRDYTLLSGGDL